LKPPWDFDGDFEVQLQAEAEGKRNVLLHTELRQAGAVKLRASSLYRPPARGAKRAVRERKPEPAPSAPPLAQCTRQPMAMKSGGRQAAAPASNDQSSARGPRPISCASACSGAS
jgi:hypothetical protein